MHPYIAIEGVIGVGKTTLARLLQPRLDAELVLEEFEENPFLSNFYADRARYAFQTQIFFLLSRYRQQIERIPDRNQAVIADYTFAKDALFAHLNLTGDELDVYDRVHDALSQQIRPPDLLIYLRASHDVLMGRIAARDRPYERDMDPEYIERLRLAYEDFVASFEQSPVLTIDTDDLNYVQHPDDLEFVLERIKSKLQYGSYQQALPGVDPTEPPARILEELDTRPGHIADFQRFHMSFDAEKGFDQDLFYNYILLTEEVGELARALKGVRRMQARLTREGHSDAGAEAIRRSRDQLRDELADCFAYLLKLSNYASIDLEAAYLEKMNLNTQRNWEEDDE